MKQLFIFFTSFALAVLLVVPAFRFLARSLDIVDRPDGKLKRHQQITPYLGGAAIFCTLWLLLLAYSKNPTGLDGLLAGTSTILMVGLVDDIIGLTPSQKLLGQSLSAALLVYYGFCLNLTWPLGIAKLLSFVWLVSLMNAFNLVDVMDGLATMFGMCATLGLTWYVAYLGPADLFVILIVFLGAQLAFFCHNCPRATIYLGDTGSMLIGALIGAVALKVNWHELALDQLWLNYLIAPLLVAVPAIEVASLIIIRRFKRIPFYNGSHDHYIHYLKRKGWKEGAILAFTALFVALFSLSSVLIAYHFLSIWRVVLILMLLLLIWIRVVFG